MNPTEFGRMVEAARAAKGLTRAVFVKQFDNVSAEYLAAIENGTTNPRLSTVLAAASVDGFPRVTERVRQLDYCPVAPLLS